ncbi:MAG: phosphoribosylformylglycinamidine synthase subunit PurS [Candidatus Thermoplasmatota archaeon]|nr:phosphoribosylformylglycinamidine synthase subunit PurS [Candidatus Thermoplasmatota archaeon]MCL5964116.1 phosphoribosylformylglycinamidine synthase subunit PurS [Candidatus Thermoplasmatota archaeon]
MIFEIRVDLKNGIFDPEGTNILKTLKLLDIDVKSVNCSKIYSVEVNEENEKRAMEIVTDAASKLLVNPVLHDFKITRLR